MAEGVGLTGWWYSLRYQTGRQLLARLRYLLAWRLYPRFPAAVRAWCARGAASCRPRPDFSWPGPVPPATAAEPAGPFDWHPAGVSFLRLLQLHYFDWAPRTPRQRLRRQMESWMARHPPGTWPSWHPYPTSVRIVHWIRAWGPALPGDAAASLAMQAAFLERNLEVHLGGNHLLENARALLAAGWFFDGSAALRWRRRGLEILLAEVDRQVLPDGGHYERAPAYHLAMTHLLRDALALLAGAGLPAPDKLRAACDRLTVFERSLRHPDGSLPLFHDSVEPDPAPAPPSSGPLSFPATGYYIFDGPHGRLIADYGAPGSDPNPAHQHAGIFSFELSAGPRRLVTDTGTETYTIGPRRDRLRSTAAHNTVRVDGADQFQVWAAFRVGRRAWVSEVREIREQRFELVSASHNGYRHLGVEHRRTIVSLPDLGWLIVDDLLGAGEHRLESFLHFAPGVDPQRPLGWAVVPFGHAAAPEVLPDARSPRMDVVEDCRTWLLRGPARLPARFGYFLGPQPVRVRTAGVPRLCLESSTGTIDVDLDPAMVRPCEVRYNEPDFGSRGDRETG